MNRNDWYCFLLMSLFFYIIPQNSRAQTVCLHSNQQFDFAESLMSEGEYDKAVIEFKRFIHVFPEDARCGKALYLIGSAYFHLGRYSESIRNLEIFIETYPGHDLSVPAYWMASEGSVKSNLPGQAVVILNKLLSITQELNERDRIWYQIGLIYAENHDMEAAAACFDAISSDKKAEYETDRLLMEIDRIPRKNPVMAGVLSVIPGGGQLYCERYQDALVAFLLNSGFIASAVEAFNKDHYALGSLISLVGFGFYAGNIYGAASSAHKYNRLQTQQIIDRYKKPYHFSISWVTDIKGAALLFTCAF